MFSISKHLPTSTPEITNNGNNHKLYAAYYSFVSCWIFSTTMTVCSLSYHAVVTTNLLHVFRTSAKLRRISNWSCHSVNRRQDVCVAKVILWILSSCTYWWENRYPLSPIAAWWYHPPYLVDDPPYPYLVDDPPTHTWLMTPLPILGWWPPYPYLPDDPPPNGWMMCWVKLVLVLYVWRQDCMRPAQQGLPFIWQRGEADLDLSGIFRSIHVRNVAQLVTGNLFSKIYCLLS